MADAAGSVTGRCSHELKRSGAKSSQVAHLHLGSVGRRGNAVCMKTRLTISANSVTIPCVIASFADRETEALFRRERVRRIDPRIQRTALRKLQYLNNAASLDDLRVPPGNRLEALAGTRAGQYSIRVNDQWRIVFTWRKGKAHDVALVDYH